MNTAEKKMVDLLTDLKENHSVVGIKTEFEVEGTRRDDLLRLKEITSKAGLGITLKIGGCEAITDLYEARSVGVAKIVAPMIETAFAMKKFVNAAKTVFPPDELEDLGLLANVETIDGYSNFDKMTELPQFAELSGVVIGRKDLAFSMELALSGVDSDGVFRICSDIFRKTKGKCPGHKCIVGGIAGAGSLDTLRAFEKGLLDEYETRKVIFSTPESLGADAVAGLKKALEFELLWYSNKTSCYSKIAHEDENYVNRIQKLAASLSEA